MLYSHEKQSQIVQPCDEFYSVSLCSFFQTVKPKSKVRLLCRAWLYVRSSKYHLHEIKFQNSKR